MPIYEYRRPDGSTFEIVQSFSEDALTKDPDSGVPVERVLHAPAVHFKGKGFYNTDYGTRKRQRETAASTDSNNSSSGDSSTKDSSASGGSDSSSNGDSATKPDSKKAESGSKADTKGAASGTGTSKPVAATK